MAETRTYGCLLHGLGFEAKHIANRKLQAIMQIMRNLMQKWWSPIVSHILSFIVFVIGLPYIFHQIHHWHDLTLISIAAMAIFSVVILAKVHGYSIKTTFLLVAIVGCLCLYTWPKEQLGNWNLQRADHILL